MDAQDEKLKQFGVYHAEHYRHAEDDDAHWTKRERDALSRKLEEMHEDIKSMPRRMYGDGVK